MYRSCRPFSIARHKRCGMNFQTMRGGGVAFRYDVRIALCYGVIFVSVASFSCVKGLHSMLASLEKCISDELYNL